MTEGSGRLGLLGGVAVGALIAGGLVPGRPGPALAQVEPAPAAEAPVEDMWGERLYGRDCASCHGSRGEGSPRGTPLIDVGGASAHYMLVTGRMPIAQPDTRIRRGPPAYGEDDIAALVAHVAAFGDGPPVPVVDVEATRLATGGRLYRLHCASCHSTTGIGGALAGNELVPSVAFSEPTTVAAAMVVGPGAMPAFAPDVFTSEEVDDIAAYVQYLADSRHPGGTPLGGAGRVDEGLVAWAVGLAGLVLVARWIGRRR